MTAPQQPTVAVFTKNRLNPAYAAARHGAAEVAARFGARTVDYVPEHPDNVEEQMALLDRAIADRPDAIVLVPVHETAIEAAVRRVEAAGIPLLDCVNRLGFPSQSRCYVGSDDVALAATVAERLFDGLGGTGTVVIIEGTPGATTARDRQRGFLEAASRYPGIRVAASRTGRYLHEEAHEAMRALLREHPVIDGVLAANDSMALGALDALDEAGRRALVVGANAIPEAIAVLRDGRMLATADFDAHKIASVAAEAAVRVVRGLPVPREIILPVEIVDASNWRAWDRPIEVRPTPAWASIVPPEFATPTA